MPLVAKIAKKLTNYRDPHSFASRRRSKRIGPLLKMIEGIYAVNGAVKILDVGGTEIYWNIVPPEFLDSMNVQITILNLPGVKMPGDHGRFRFAVGDGCNLREFEDNSFDIVHSNSVLEHVGEYERMVQFAREISRIAPRYFVQTPNFWFPVEPHCMVPFFHWLPEPLRISLVLRFNLGHWTMASSVQIAVQTVQSARLLSRTLMCSLFPDGKLVKERFLGFPKSLIVIRDRM